VSRIGAQFNLSEMIYEYDFGDGWEHEILLEKVLPRDSMVSIRAASAPPAPARPRIAAELTGMQIFWKRLLTRSTRSTTSISIGSAVNSIPRNSTWLSLKAS
jgi:hypothetical protein